MRAVQAIFKCELISCIVMQSVEFHAGQLYACSASNI